MFSKGIALKLNPWRSGISALVHNCNNMVVLEILGPRPISNFVIGPPEGRLSYDSLCLKAGVLFHQDKVLMKL